MHFEQAAGMDLRLSAGFSAFGPLSSADPVLFLTLSSGRLLTKLSPFD
jgi:hypothetical protein